MIDITNWREKELSLDEVLEKYPEVPRFIALKIDIKRRGIHYTDRAREAVNPDIHLVPFGGIGIDTSELGSPSGFLFRDGTSVVETDREVYDFHREPYTIDFVDGKFYVLDEGKILEEITLWEKPDFYHKKTSHGTVMGTIVGSRSQRMDIDPNWICHFWDNPKDGCKYCGLCAAHRSVNKVDLPEYFFEDITETVSEAIKQKGRFADIHMTGGSILSGTEIFDDEVELYIKTIQAAGEALKEHWIPMQLNASAFSVKQLQRLKNESGITTFDSDIEVFNPEIFKRICPGKERYVGYNEWKKRIFDAVDVFGRGYVNSAQVIGVEFSGKEGFTSEEEAFEDNMKYAEEFVKHDVALTLNVWSPCKGSILFRENNPSLEYYVRLAKGYADLHRQYKISIIPDDYRRCSNHINMDFDRLIDFQG